MWRSYSMAAMSFSTVAMKDILAASSGFGQRSMTISVSSRILEIAEGLPTIHPWANGPGHQWSCFPEGPSPMPFAKIEQ